MRALPVTAGLDAVLDALRAALAGTGPALLPLPAGVASEAVVQALRPEEPLENDDVALVVPTSGSTGGPKGVLLSATALRASASATHERLGGPGRWLLALPTTHIAGLQVLVRSLLAGTDPVPLGVGPFQPAAFAVATDAMGGDRRYTSLVPTQLSRVLEAGGEPLAALTSYDAVLVGGAAAPPVLMARARAAGVAVVTTYGMSETSGGCVYDGVPLAGARVDTQDGIVRIAGPMLASGYRLRPDLTRAAFADGWFTTSDLGRLDRGRLSVLGRADDVIVTGGEKVAPAAVEAVLAGHPAVAEVVVVGVPDAEWGQRVVAVVRPRGEHVLSLDEAREHVTAVLPRAAAPRELRVVDTFPLLPSGKPDRAALAGR
ncbi:MAG: o-succinylbenzoate--CoA ligase [Mycobacteriales bacterium]